MLDQTYKLPRGASEIVGDLAALSEQLGSTTALCRLPGAAALLETAEVKNRADFDRFLSHYSSTVLVPHELPTVASAYGHVERYEIRELVALDSKLSALPALRSFARASQTVGQAQLRRLRPLRGERLVQRYIRAVDEGQAQAWHTLVFGLVLALYSLPLRQGLVHFAQQTLLGFARGAGARLRLAPADRERLLEAQAAGIVAAVDSIVSRGGPPAG